MDTLIKRMDHTERARRENEAPLLQEAYAQKIKVGFAVLLGGGGGVYDIYLGVVVFCSLQGKEFCVVLKNCSWASLTAAPKKIHMHYTCPP